MTTLYVNKVSDTSADTLLALGAGSLFRSVLRHLKKAHTGIVLRDIGDTTALDLPCTLRREELQGKVRISLLAPLKTPKQTEKQSKKGRSLEDAFDYEGQKQKRSDFIQQRMQLPAHLRTPEATFSNDPRLAELLKSGPQPELAHYMAINVMKVADTFNEIVLSWLELTAEQQWQAVTILYDLFSLRANDLPAAAKNWATIAKKDRLPTMVTAVQVINPSTGKGTNVTKSYRLNSKGLDSFWLLELLKFQGFLQGATPYVLKGSKDRKTYVIAPQVVELETLDTIMQTFNRICWSSTAIKQDILAALRLTQVLVRHRRAEIEQRKKNSETDDDFEEEQPLLSIARGFDVTFYKDMGSAHATMNVATVNIPGWFPRIATLEDTDEAELLLQEHLRIIRRIEGYQGKEGNDEIALLQAYRDFLSGHDIHSFWHFAASYGFYLFRQRDHEKEVKRWLPQLTVKGFTQLMAQQQQTSYLRKISETPGFQHIASAIREATVRAQRRKSQENDNTYEIRYGIGQQLMRKAQYRDDFMIELSEFLLTYNAETAREEEKVARRLQRHLTSADYKAHKLRYPVTTKDIDQLAELLDSYPTELVAKMLIAYGYARREALKPEEIQAEQEEAATSDILRESTSDSDSNEVNEDEEAE